MAGWFCSHAKILRPRILQIGLGEIRLTSFLGVGEPLKPCPTTAFQGAIFRASHFPDRGEARNSPFHQQDEYKPHRACRFSDREEGSSSLFHQQDKSKSHRAYHFSDRGEAGNSFFHQHDKYKSYRADHFSDRRGDATSSSSFHQQEKAKPYRGYHFPDRRGEASISSFLQQDKPKSHLHGRMTELKVSLSGLSKWADHSHFKFWPPDGWLRALSGRQQQIEEVLSGVNSRRKSLSFDRQPRRMLQNSLRRNQKNGDKSSVLEAGVKYNVIRIEHDGGLQHLVLKSSQLGLHPRDVDLLSSSTFIPQRATIVVQRDKVLVRMENVRAIVFKDHVLLFDARHQRISTEGVFASLANPRENCRHRARDAFAKALAQQAKEVPVNPLDPMPFHLRVMESLLEETSNFFHQKVDRLKMVGERTLQELTADVSMAGLQKLLPLKKAITAVEHDVRDAHEAMDQVLSSDDTLQALCLVNEDSSRPGAPFVVPDPQRANCEQPSTTLNREEHIANLRQAAADMLLTYQREVDDAGGVLEELRKGMEAAQEVWELGLDSTRNRIISMTLYSSIFSCSLALAVLPAALFGMNLPSGYEEHPTLFYWIAGASLTTPLVMLFGLALAFRVWPKIVDKRRAQDLTGLLDLLHHLDNIDDIVDSVARDMAGKEQVTAKQFREILRSHPTTQFMRQKELDLIFRMFDRNRNGLLETKELRTASSPPGPDSDHSSNRENK